MLGSYLYPVFKLRGLPVMLDCDVAKSLGVSTREVNQLMKRRGLFNQEDYCFKLHNYEFEMIRSDLMRKRYPRNRRHQYVVYTVKGVTFAAQNIRTLRAKGVTSRVLHMLIGNRVFAFPQNEHLVRQLESEQFSKKFP